MQETKTASTASKSGAQDFGYCGILFFENLANWSFHETLVLLVSWIISDNYATNEGEMAHRYQKWHKLNKYLGLGTVTAQWDVSAAAWKRGHISYDTPRLWNNNLMKLFIDALCINEIMFWFDS